MTKDPMLRQWPTPIWRPRIQWRPNWMANERRLCLTRIRWEHGEVGAGGYSAKLSISVQFIPHDVLIGLHWKPKLWGFLVWICIIPCLPIRLHFKRSYGGILP